MQQAFDIDQCVGLLIDAWTGGTQLRELPASARPQDVSQGYDIQDRLIEALAPDPVVGWKLGAGSHKVKRASGVGRSIAGRLLRSRVFASGDRVTLLNDSPVTVEIELAFVLAHDVLPGAGIDDPLSVVSGARLTAELVQSRFFDRRAVGWPSFAADDAGFGALVAGPEIAWSELAELRESMNVSVDGVHRAGAAIGDDVTDPFQALADLLAIARERDMVLPAGSIISTGSQSAPFELSGGGKVLARTHAGVLAFTI
ncbi:fumarylacetoacetate hydrolase family protein [soil metagenome]